ncbi:DinB family protein [Pseudemcibacter aquimaris]|uniref:DinB family protein n=1 Tax=Pseudemcibacter aquimaris TaxID=2857064 RepID=UPI0020115480|nr:DinB family protein [Pseudemcibacter aquimaris]MCC3861917.1 DinB family protein [Pseudemcibacter aquimaris]WDU58669.1 DinB family protein [Pseudemcibacter aquimaris]
MNNASTIRQMVAYMAWADDVMLKNVESIPSKEIIADRNALFKNIAGTFDHILVVGEIFKAHLEGRPIPHNALRRQETLAFNEIAKGLRSINKSFVTLSNEWSQNELEEDIQFTFIDGKRGKMTRTNILMHLVNHATYHRGFISTLLYPIKSDGAANDLTVFLRDIWPKYNRSKNGFTI